MPRPVLATPLSPRDLPSNNGRGMARGQAIACRGVAKGTWGCRCREPKRRFKLRNDLCIFTSWGRRATKWMKKQPKNYRFPYKFIKCALNLGICIKLKIGMTSNLHTFTVMVFIFDGEKLMKLETIRMSSFRNAVYFWRRHEFNSIYRNLVPCGLGSSTHEYQKHALKFATGDGIRMVWIWSSEEFSLQNIYRNGNIGVRGWIRTPTPNDRVAR